MSAVAVGLQPDRPLVALLPGSRRAEAARHLPVLLETMARLERRRPLNFLLPASHTTLVRLGRRRGVVVGDLGG